MSATNSRALKLLAGFALAPLTPGLVFLFISAIEMKLGEGVWALKLSAMVGYPAMIALGLPAHLLLEKLGWTNLWGYMFAGLLIGTVVAFVVFSVVGNAIGSISDLEKLRAPSAAIVVLAAFFGALSGMVFWAITRPAALPTTT